jgi:hypothetical protein
MKFFLVILISLLFCLKALGQAQVITVKDSAGLGILYKNKDTLYTRKLDKLFYTHRVYHFTAWYPGTHVVRHEFIIKQHPACYDCYITSTKREWEYDETGHLKYFYKEKKKGGRRGPTICKCLTKHYEKGRLINIERKNCSEE